jgi:hypothetical protein
LVTGPV